MRNLKQMLKSLPCRFLRRTSGPFSWLGLLLLCASLPQAGHQVSVGIRSQGNYDFEPGNNWYSGLEAEYAHPDILGGRPRMAISYLTSRMEEMAGRNVLVEDWLLLSPSWHFRPHKRFDPYLRFDIGYTRFDDEGMGLEDTGSAILAPLVGVQWNFLPGKAALYYDVGFSLINSSPVDPGVFSLGLRMNAFPWKGGVR